MAHEVEGAARSRGVAVDTSGLADRPHSQASAPSPVLRRPITEALLEAWRTLTGGVSTRTPLSGRNCAVAQGPSIAPPVATTTTGRFPFNYTVNGVLHDPAKARAFVRDYFDHEAPFFAMTRDARTGMSFDGINLDPVSREPVSQRRWTAASKECLDVALLAKIVAGDPLAQRLMSRDQAVQILARKIESYERFSRDYPGYGGFLPWLSVSADGSMAPSDSHWKTHIPALDNGEWAFVLLGAEKVLRDHGDVALADRYKVFNDKLAHNMRRIFFDEKANAVRDQALISDSRDPNAIYKSFPNGYIRHEHGVYEGAMALQYMSLYAQPRLTQAQVSGIWKQTHMQRLETAYGTTWRGFWGSSHEEWEFAIMPKRDLPEWRDLFRIRQEIRTQDAAHRGKPGFGASINPPGAPKEPYAVNHGIRAIASERVTDYPFYAIYGSFPVLLEQTRPGSGREGVAWLLNTLRAPNAVTSIGGGESVRNDGRASAPVKTIDGTFLNLLALTGGFEDVMRARMQADGTYDGYTNTLRGEYRETFTRLREPSGFAAPRVSVPNST